ncbi:glutamine synthetase [Gordonia spumicola]|uniref:Glutamine synthetase n=1 Tax=Gordonia spumicola TaxID=589161 RepID=A0A7I9VFE9_9ACTN|nr:glutamine synthetase family protein [Gordonia spumicola]GED99558.1 glutamine synthetase [Gordonia spumicola]GED99950.1 glutamine synthetase [Gordonia spumicola]GEE04099.1 glutamine synthetase [Gordonia spumicola]GEE04127.1 glutamine synthetase [Gordonia spumicola]
MSSETSATDELTDVRSVRIEMTNHDGALLGKSLSPTKYLSARDKGFTVADLVLGLDLTNHAQLGFGFPAWREGFMPDLFARPDLETLVEWKPGQASVICDFWTADGDPVEADPRQALKRIAAAYADRGYTVTASVEIEATVFRESIDEARAKQYQDLTPLGGNAGAALILAKSPDFTEYAEAVVARLDELGIPWEAWSDEAASGQIEFNLAPDDAVTAADLWARTRQVMREVAYSLGRSITFMSKWSTEYGQGSHLNVSVCDENGNVFFDSANPQQPSATMLHFLGGVMGSLKACTSFALPTITSYRRLIDLEGPPTTLTWGVGNKSCAVRAVMAGPGATRLEYRLPSADSNTYLALATFLAAGLAGIDSKAMPPPAYELMAWAAPDEVAPRVPADLYSAVAALADDTVLREYLGEEFVDYWVGTRRWEWLTFHTETDRNDDQISVWESNRYFELA